MSFIACGWGDYHSCHFKAALPTFALSVYNSPFAPLTSIKQAQGSVETLQLPESGKVPL